jgi:hypothetical protein
MKNPIKSTAPLPVPLAEPRGGLPALKAVAQLDADLAALEKAVEECAGANPWPSEADLAILHGALPRIAELRAAFRAVDRPATYSEITAEILKLTTTLATSGNIQTAALAKQLCEDVSELRPTAFVLERACRLVRGGHEFLSLHALEQEIANTTKTAARYRAALDADLAEMIEGAEESARLHVTRMLDYERKQKVAERRRAKKEAEHETLMRQLDPVRMDEWTKQLEDNALTALQDQENDE